MRSRRVRLDQEEVVKFFPENPPRRGDIVLVDGVRHRVIRSKISWRDPGIWTLDSLRVRRA